MGATIRVDYRTAIAVDDFLNGSIQHRVDQLRIRACSYGPAHNQSVEAVNDGREIDLSGRYMELRDVGKPFLIWRCRLKVPIDDVFWCRTNFPQVRPIPPLSIDVNAGRKPRNFDG